MDRPFAHCKNPAKRRLLGNALFVPETPDLETPNDNPAIDDTSDDDDSDSDPDKPKYDESQEFFPDCLAFDPRVEGVTAMAEATVQRLDDVLGQYATLNKDLENMKAKTAEVMKSRTPRETRIGFLGGTGAGKSALLNSLTDIPNLAKEMSAGEACTSVPMVYMHQLPGQTAPFAAKVSYIPATESRGFLSTQLENYNLYTFKFNQDWTEDEKNNYFQEADTAFNAFRTLFCDKPEFQSSESAKEALAQSYRSSRPGMLVIMMTNWYTERLRQTCQGQDASHTVCEGRKVVDLRAILDPLITPTCVFEVPSLWPLVKEVHVGVPSSRVLRHLSIADLPGMTDTNKIRTNATHDHIRECQVLWYIVSAERACTDKALDEAIRNYADRFPGTFDVVLTKIDQGINDDLAGEMRLKGQSLGDYDNHKTFLDRHKKLLDRFRRKIKKDSATAAQKDGFRQRVESLEAHVDTLKSRKMECIVDARNRSIVARLKQEKTRHLPEGEKLQVHCISNQHYAIHKGDAPKEGPLLDVNCTGVPGLRSYALRLTALAVWECHKEILVHKLKVLFQGVHGWALHAPTQHNRGLPDVVTTVKNLWECISEASVDRCVQDFSSAVVSKLRAELPSSLADTLRYLSVIKSDDPRTFLAFFRKSGKHSTKAVGPRIWNESFIEWQTNNVFNPAWHSWPNPQNSFDEGVDKVVKALEDIPDQLEAMPESVPLSIRAFVNVLQGQVALIRAERDRTKSQYKDKYRNIKSDACRDQHTGYFAQAMEPCYSAGKADKDTGVCARVQNLLTNHINNNNPLETAIDKLEDTFRDTAWAQAHALRTRVKKILDEIDQQFKLIVRVGSETPEEIEARSKISEVLADVMPHIERIELELKEIEETYPQALS